VRVLERHLSLAVSLAVCDVAEQRVLVKEHLGDTHACAHKHSERKELGPVQAALKLRSRALYGTTFCTL